jgi:hypothetical protein
MTYPGDVKFHEQAAPVSQEFNVEQGDLLPPQAEFLDDNPYPAPILKGIRTERLEAFKQWIEGWLTELDESIQRKRDQWADEERAYRAASEGPMTEPFVGACGDVIPAIAMAVDPVHARLDTGIFKADPVIKLKALRKDLLDTIPGMERFIQFYQKHKLNLRSIVSPRLMESCKHGTMVLCTEYDHTKYDIMTYDERWNPVKREVTTFKGPRVYAVALSDFLFPPHYQHLQDCPVVFERVRTTLDTLRIMEASSKIENVDALVGQGHDQRTTTEIETERSTGHEEHRIDPNKVVVYKGWCDYDLNGDELPERIALLYHWDTRTLLMLRYNWYFHQRKPYTVIPYIAVTDSLYGFGLGEMIKPLQDMLTQFHRHAMNNAYLVNCRMFISSKDSGVEQKPRLFSGRVFKVNDPTKDFIPFSMADVYPSTLTERQNLFGLIEKRTGISDYLTGRESPIVGSRATATSTVALIQEGTKRVEEVLENIRVGIAEVIENCVYIWIQYGLGEIGDDETAQQVRKFFSSVNQSNVNGSIAIDLAATDAMNNRQIQQQIALAIINVMMQYYTKLVEAGQLAMQAAQQMPDLAELIKATMHASRELFKDLLTKYDIPNPEDYLPALEDFLAQPTAGQGVTGLPSGGPGGPGGAPVVAGPAAAPPGVVGNGGTPPSRLPGFNFGLPVPGGGANVT